jgi:hypothetical protein
MLHHLLLLLLLLAAAHICCDMHLLDAAASLVIAVTCEI